MGNRLVYGLMSGQLRSRSLYGGAGNGKMRQCLKASITQKILKSFEFELRCWK